MTVKDFEGLSIPKLTKKLQEVESVEFLSELEAWEKANEDRTGAKKAINERQGVLIDKQQVVRNESKIENSELGAEGSGEVSVEGNGEVEAEAKDIDNGSEPKAGYVDQALEAPAGIDHVKKCRETLYFLMSCAEHKRDIVDSVRESIFFSRAWLGVLIGEMGRKNPYDVEVKTKQDIPATADTGSSNHFKLEVRQFGLKNKLDAILWLRDQLNEVANDIREIEEAPNEEGQVAKMQAWVKIREAKFDLGLMLSELRDR